MYFLNIIFSFGSVWFLVLFVFLVFFRIRHVDISFAYLDSLAMLLVIG